MRTSGLGSIDASANGAPPLTARTSQIFESSHTSLGLFILELPSCPWSCNTGIALLGIEIGTNEEGGSGGV